MSVGTYPRLWSSQTIPTAPYLSPRFHLSSRTFHFTCASAVGIRTKEVIAIAVIAMPEERGLIDVNDGCMCSGSHSRTMAALGMIHRQIGEFFDVSLETISVVCYKRQQYFYKQGHLGHRVNRRRSGATA